MNQIHETRKEMDLILKNKRTDEIERIIQQNIALNPWGLSFNVNTELEAYKSAYAYIGKKIKIDYCPENDKWLITVFKNDEMAQIYG